MRAKAAQPKPLITLNTNRAAEIPPGYSKAMSETEIVVMSGSAYAAARELILEYADALGVDLCFQNFSEELEALETMYGPPRGLMLLAWQSNTTVGCVGVRAISASTCEMKRLYVRTQARGVGIGRALAIEAIRLARSAGYKRMVLDTLVHMIEARKLYGTLGFRQCAPYYENPLQGVVYMELVMSEDGTALTQSSRC
jgi:ribosomal protein S18 acetylase RimI-like enzyme